MVPNTHGSDATGSLRTPCCVVRRGDSQPDLGEVSASVPPAGQPPNDASRDFVIARHSEDLALAFDLLTGSKSPRGVPGASGSGCFDHDPELGLQVHDSCQDGVRKAGPPPRGSRSSRRSLMARGPEQLVGGGLRGLHSGHRHGPTQHRGLGRRSLGSTRSNPANSRTGSSEAVEHNRSQRVPTGGQGRPSHGGARPRSDPHLVGGP